MTPQLFEQLSPSSWRQIPGFANMIERPAKTMIKAWVFLNGAPTELEGTIFERCQRSPFNREEPDPNYQRFYVFSVPDESMGRSNPFRDYFINSPEPRQVYKLSRSQLIDHLLGLFRKQLTEIEPQYKLIKWQIEALTKLMEANEECGE